MGAAIGVQLKNAVDAEINKPLDCSDIDASKAVEEVARLRGILHSYMDLDETVENGLKSLFDAWVDGKEYMDLGQTCECYKGFTSNEITEDGMLDIIHAHGIDESKIDFVAFETIFLPSRTDRSSLNVPKADNGSVETKQLIATLHKRTSTMFLDKSMLESLITEELGQKSVPKTISKDDMVKVKAQIKRVKLIHDAFLTYDKDENGTVDAEEIMYFVEKSGEHISLDEVHEMMEELKPGSSETGMEFKEFLDTMGCLIASNGEIVED